MSDVQASSTSSQQVTPTSTAGEQHAVTGGTETRTLATVPNVVATHVLGESSIAISIGDLILLSSPTSTAGADSTSTSEPTAKTGATATPSPPLDSPGKLKHTTHPVAEAQQSNDKIGEHLTLVVGAHAAFPLYPTTLFGTIAGDTKVYLFAPEFGGPNHLRDGGGQGGYIKLTFPHTVDVEGSEESKAQEQFEKVLPN
jgi:hypothetical protein